MIRSNVLPFPHAAAPSINEAETRWVAGELAGLLRQIDPDSPAGHVLRRTRRELESLAESAAPVVIGPIRVKMKATAA
ncbi:MAG: hypothetical protein ACRC7O_09245 [Fimbriiglobus sp.]